MVNAWGRAMLGAAVTALLMTGVPAVTATAAPVAENGATTAVRWGDCDEATLRQIPADQHDRYSCAWFRVPVDHDNAELGSIDLALLRRAADSPESKIGSLFLNPGGPGGAGRTMPVVADRFLDQPVLDRFDIIGFDPRGVGQSHRVQCFATVEDAREVLGSQSTVPLSRAEISGTLAAYQDYAGFCRRNAGALLEHLSTKNVVRDLDLLRAAVGDERLNYVGFSYGTLIGATYANMFPLKVRAMVLDGNVDPALRTKDGLRYDRERAQGFERVLDAFLTECERAGDRCAFGADQPKRKFAALRERLRRGPITLPDGNRVTINSFTSGVAGSLYSARTLPDLANVLQVLYDIAHAPSNPDVSPTARDLQPLFDPPQNARLDALPDTPYTTDDSYFGVNCADKVFRHRQDGVPEIAAEWERESPNFGRTQAFADAAGCPAWPAREGDAYRGPWNASTEHPVLVIGNYHDPATQYEFSRRMADQLGFARLLSVDAFGHCILGQSTAVDKATADYLVDLVTPPPGRVYQPDERPFGAPPAG